MEAINSAAQALEREVAPKRYVLTWAEVRSRLILAPKGKLYGVPRGGAIVAGLTGRAVDTPEQADFIVDDILDSGATRARYAANGKPFWSLVDKQAEELMGTWVVFPWEANDDETADVADTVLRQLEFIGEDPRRDGLLDTPKRVIKSLLEMTSGYADNPREILSKVFDVPYDEMVVLHGIEFWSLCEHHLLPFHGTAAIGYIPNGKVVGISKLARLVNCFSRRLQVQERLTQEIANAIADVLKPQGVGVLLKATHLCMAVRGVKIPSDMVTSCMMGLMRDDSKARSEFLELARNGNK